MFSKLFGILFKIALVLILVSFFVPQYREKWVSWWQDVTNSNEFKKLNISLKEVEKKAQDNLPKPLVVKTDVESSNVTLDAKRVFEETNSARKVHNLSPLTFNNALAKAALTKAHDMFDHEYFDHNSPQGKTPSSFVSDAGYEYLTVGENLAMGIFKDERDLVEAWMNSPGHRANILNTHFTEVGISAVKGMYKGEEVWMSVQEFGKPASLCPSPSEKERNGIEEQSKESELLFRKLKEIKKQIESMTPEDSAYQGIITSYNNLVEEYNSLINKLEMASEKYNTEVAEYNACLEKELK